MSPAIAFALGLFVGVIVGFAAAAVFAVGNGRKKRAS